MVNNTNPPINLERVISRGEHRYVTYQVGAKELNMAYYTFVFLARDAKANFRTLSGMVVDMNKVYRYLDQINEMKEK